MLYKKGDHFKRANNRTLITMQLRANLIWGTKNMKLDFWKSSAISNMAANFKLYNGKPYLNCFNLVKSFRKQFISARAKSTLTILVTTLNNYTKLINYYYNKWIFKISFCYVVFLRNYYKLIIDTSCKLDCIEFCCKYSTITIKNNWYF